MGLPTSLLILSLLHLTTPALSADVLLTDSKDNSQNCSCYVIDSGADNQTASYFTYYRFWDFRNAATSSTQYIRAPPQVNNTQDGGQEEVFAEYQDYLNGSDWNRDWGIQNWIEEPSSDFPIKMVNSPANVYMLQNNASDNNSDFNTYLTLRTTRLEDFSSTAEIENEQKNLMHASLRVKARVKGAAGAVAGFFTFYNDDNESDIEILTQDPTDLIRYTNQPSVDKHGNDIDQSSINGTNLPSWQDWHDHRIDWLSKHSYWYFDGKQVANNTYSVPRKASGLVMNMWSNGGTWSGNMSVGDSAEFHIQWIELLFNTSGSVEGPGGGDDHHKREVLEKRKKSKGCQVICRVDGVKNVGFPEVAYVSKGLAPTIKVSWGLLAVVGLMSFLVGL